MSDEGAGYTPAESGDFVLVTYREIAERFRLGSPKAARTKVKRAGWTHDPPNHPADPLRIRVPRGSWDQATDSPLPQPPETRGSRKRNPGAQAQEAPPINGFEAFLKALQEQLQRERERADLSEARVRELAEQMIDLREGRAAALAKAEAAEARVDDLMAEVRKLGNAEARAELLQVDVERLRAEAERMKAELTTATLKTGRRSWLRAWLRRENGNVDRGKGRSTR